MPAKYRMLLSVPLLSALCVLGVACSSAPTTEEVGETGSTTQDLIVDNGDGSRTMCYTQQEALPAGWGITRYYTDVSGRCISIQQLNPYSTGTFGVLQTDRLLRPLPTVPGSSGNFCHGTPVPLGYVVTAQQYVSPDCSYGFATSTANVHQYTIMRLPETPGCITSCAGAVPAATHYIQQFVINPSCTGQGVNGMVVCRR